MLMLCLIAGFGGSGVTIQAYALPEEVPFTTDDSTTILNLEQGLIDLGLLIEQIQLDLLSIWDEISSIHSTDNTQNQKLVELENRIEILEGLHELENIEPIASFDPSIIYHGLEVTAYQQVLFKSDSYDPDGYIVSEQWDFGDGSPNEFGNTLYHTWTNEGRYNVTLWVTDNDGAVAINQLGEWDVQPNICGDTILDPVIEDCDEGPNNGHGYCSETCTIVPAQQEP